jgi:hypothetical protein
VLIVSDTAIALPVPDSHASPLWLLEFEAVPQALRDAAERHASTPLVPLDASLLPKQARVVPAETIKLPFAAGVFEGWSTFRRNFQANGWHAFSTVVTAADGLDALVYEEMHCGGTCGEGAYVWLRRDSRAAAWVIQRRIVAWVS